MLAAKVMGGRLSRGVSGRSAPAQVGWHMQLELELALLACTLRIARGYCIVTGGIVVGGLGTLRPPASWP